jgi:hypothetical protein
LVAYNLVFNWLVAFSDIKREASWWCSQWSKLSKIFLSFKVLISWLTVPDCQPSVVGEASEEKTVHSPKCILTSRVVSETTSKQLVVLTGMYSWFRSDLHDVVWRVLIHCLHSNIFYRFPILGCLVHFAYVLLLFSSSKNY